jgi:hypothetical protein
VYLRQGAGLTELGASGRGGFDCLPGSLVPV